MDKQRAEILEEINLEICRHFTKVGSGGHLINAPGSSVKHLHPKNPERIKVENEELDQFIQAAYKVTLPKKVITSGHRAPFDFLADLFYERVKNALAFANRTGGKTFATALLNHIDMLFKRQCEVASAGATLDQANKCYRYFKGFMESKWFLDFCERYRAVMRKDFIEKSIQSWTKFDNGSIAEIITGSERGLRGPHPNKARIDEVDEIPWDVLQTGLSMAASSPVVRGQNVFTSTRQKMNGSMQRLLDTAEEKGIDIYEWNIWEALAKCTRRCIDDPEHGTCPIYAYCKGKAHHCDGFYAIDDFIEKVRLIDRDAFETEWENKKPSRHKVVYHKFDSTRHIMTPRKLSELTGYTSVSRYWPRVAGLDFGSSPGHPFCYGKLAQLPNGAWLLFYEYVMEQRLLRDHAQAIRQSPYYVPGEPIFSDWDAQDRLELKALGIRTKPANKEVTPGIDFIQTLLSGYPPIEDPMLYVWWECTYAIQEFNAYSWPVGPDGKVKKDGNPLKVDDHVMDLIRYALYSNKGSGTVKYRATRVAGL